MSSLYEHVPLHQQGDISHKVISVATTNAKALRNSLPSLTDHNACRVIGNLIAERAMEADVFAVAFEPRRDDWIEGKLAIVLDTIKENGVIFFLMYVLCSY
ncbi:hypothetical protein Droror1_Dr00017382 [Drosera rotundifolia]